MRVNLVSALVAAFIAAFFLSFSPAAAQGLDQPTGEVRYWAHGGPAITTLGAGGSVGLGVEFDRHILSLRMTTTDPAFGEETWDVALLYGRGFPVYIFFISGGVGVSAAGGTSYRNLFGNDEGAPFGPMMGFPLEGRISLAPLDFAAISLYAFANVNTGHPFGGIGVNLQVGNL